MFPRRKTPRKKEKDQPASPLSEKARQLAEQQAQLQEKIEQTQRVITEAPKLAQERVRQQRDELVTRASRTETRTASRATLPDRRFSELNVAFPARQKGLRAERRRGRLTFFFLLSVFSTLVYYLYYTVTRS